MRSTQKVAGISLLVLSALLFMIGLSSTAALAQPATQAGPASVITVAAAQTASVQVRGFCLDFGKPFPAASTGPSDLAPDNVRAALNYAITKNYTTSDPRQVQDALWFLSGTTWQRTDHALGQEIVNAASDPANAPAAPTGATSLVDAIKGNQLTAKVSFQPPAGTAPADAFYGDGTLTLTNTGTQDVQVYVPVGGVFPPVTAGDQRLVGFVMSGQQAGPGAAQPTSTEVAGGTPATTETAGATSTTGATAVATGTTEATAAATSTTAATAMPTETAAATSTTAATAVPTETVAAATAVATETAMPTETPMATATATTPNLPKTGAGSSGLPGWLILFAASLAALFAGAALLRRGAATHQ